MLYMLIPFQRPSVEMINTQLMMFIVLLLQYAEELMLIGEDRIGVTSTLINQICSVFKQPRMIQHAQTLIDILVSAVLYGNVHKKSERYAHADITCLYIY